MSNKKKRKAWNSASGKFKAQNSLDNPTVNKIITLWNSLGRNTISSFGYRGRKMYNLRPWNL